MEGGFLAGQEGEIIGRKTAEAIYGRQQISAKSFHATDDGMKEGEAYFVIPGEWIAMRSSALRRGDSVEVLSVSGGAINLGTYRIAFVKDADEREVWDIGPAGEILYEPEAMPDRTDALAAIDHVEIIATKAEYYAIRDFAAGAGAPSLVLVQKEAEL
ncbi:MAG: hypothetical protein LBS32_03835 [Clostridiales Family XIII bacterium]|nr:hypothetical protein [Clostridiales Family XIII bacterium]